MPPFASTHMDECPDHKASSSLAQKANCSLRSLQLSGSEGAMRYDENEEDDRFRMIEISASSPLHRHEFYSLQRDDCEHAGKHRRHDSVEELREGSDYSMHSLEDISTLDPHQEMPQAVPVSMCSSTDSAASFHEEEDAPTSPKPAARIPARSSLKSSTTSTSTTSSSSTFTKKSVSFDSITVHYHAIGMGDSPSVTKGPPVSLTWLRLMSERYLNVEHYEAQRPELRGKKFMRMRSARREKVLLRQGSTEAEIAQVIAEVQALQQQHEDDMDDIVDDCHPDYHIAPPTPATGNNSACCGSPDPLTPWWFDWACR